MGWGGVGGGGVPVTLAAYPFSDVNGCGHGSVINDQRLEIWSAGQRDAHVGL